MNYRKAREMNFNELMRHRKWKLQRTGEQESLKGNETFLQCKKYLKNILPVYTEKKCMVLYNETSKSYTMEVARGIE